VTGGSNLLKERFRSYTLKIFAAVAKALADESGFGGNRTHIKSLGNFYSIH
jgi:hypothetical protein